MLSGISDFGFVMNSMLPEKSGGMHGVPIHCRWCSRCNSGRYSVLVLVRWKKKVVAVITVALVVVGIASPWLCGCMLVG